RRFRSRAAAFEVADAPVVTFPPEGAEVERLDGQIVLKLRGGRAPFTVLADGVPLRTGLRAREALLPMVSAGFVTLSVVDAEGRSSRVRLWLR
ncbi:MAG: penicillin-binding protein 1C, partial [Gemmobacter sp.]|nr:penicillin-binding protein 1C [Gemmobacter sp.]